MKTTLLFLFLFLLHSCNFNKKTTNDENSTYTEETASNEYEQIEEESNTGDENSIEIIEYKAIDLGLPSGTLWADKNIGAKSEKGYGDFFAWGEKSPKYDYTWDNYNASDYYDAATVNMGEEWCIPTEEQFKELIMNCECIPNIYSWGYFGINLVGPNGNSIFLYATGFYDYDSRKLRQENSVGHYWSSCADENNYNSAKELRFRHTGGEDILLTIGNSSKCCGLPIRAVKRKKTTNNSETSKIEYKAIDLGLPSGTLWADRNVGAKSVIDDLGHKFAWGETEQKEEYNYENYKFRDYSQRITVYAVTKYSNYGENIINKNEFEAIDDAATVNMGESWCTPTIEQIKELIDNCTIEFTVGGYKFIGPNGNFIYFKEDTEKDIDDVNSRYIYWSSSLTNEDIFAHCFTFYGDFGKLQIQQKMRYEGGYIRAVKK